MRFECLTLALLLGACGGPATAPPPAPSPAPSPPEVSIPASDTDREALATTAGRLAGLSGEEADPSWSRHAGLMEELWARLEDRHLGPMRSWAEGELDLAAPEAPLFYPFSGPDLPSALQFFPRASTYVLVGLEPPGRIPNLEGLDGERLDGDALDGDALDGELERLRGGLESLVEAGYFVTKKMEADFASPHLGGVLPALYLFLARAGLTPQAVRFVRLDASGRVEAMEAVTDLTATAVEIALAGAEGEAKRTLYYFAQDLSNRGLAAAPAFAAFLRSLGAFNVYMKSASYLLHMEDFSGVKALMLERAGTVLQDDSGFPLRELSPEVWERRFFGTYTRTLPTYAEWFQGDLRAVYERGDVAPLPFAIGYHSQIGGSCLIWAQRRGE